MTGIVNPDKEQAAWLSGLKQRVRASQTCAVIAGHTELLNH